MFKNGFAKYARAVSNETERSWLYKKYIAKIVALIVFLALCLAFIVAALALEERLEESWALAVITLLFLAWIVSGIAALCLAISFRSAYKAIINRPATQGEMPEVTAYRQKVVQDKRSNFKKLWWAWLVFGVCAVAFLACMVMEVMENPGSDDFGVWGTIGFWVLLAGALTLVLAYILNSMLKQQRGSSFEQQTAQEAEAIDRAQGRKTKYNILYDANVREEKMYEYMFPNAELRAEATRERKRRSKIIFIGGIIIAIIAAAAGIVAAYSANLFGKNIGGYILPIFFTVFFGGIIALSCATGGRLKAIEFRQKAELETNPAYALNLEWYRLYSGFYKFKGKIIFIFIAVGIALGWVFAVLSPDTELSVLLFVPMIVGLIPNHFFVKDLRKKALLIERVIDEQWLHSVRFAVADYIADRNVRVYYDGNCLMCEGAAGGVTLYLGEIWFCIGVDGESCRAVSFSSEQIDIESLPQADIPVPQDAGDGVLTALLGERLADGTCRSIVFDGGVSYDPVTKNLLVGYFYGELPAYRIFKNVYVQLSENGELLAVICTGICGDI